VASWPPRYGCNAAAVLKLSSSSIFKLKSWRCTYIYLIERPSIFKLKFDWSIHSFSYSTPGDAHTSIWLKDLQSSNLSPRTRCLTQDLESILDCAAHLTQGLESILDCVAQFLINLHFNLKFLIIFSSTLVNIFIAMHCGLPLSLVCCFSETHVLHA
jgi:hypothetical protein